MTASVKIHARGEKRRGLAVLTPDTYDLCRDGQFVTLSVRCSIETEQTFMGFSGWVVTGYFIDTLKALPTRWQRFKAWLLFRDAPLARAITVVATPPRSRT